MTWTTIWRTPEKNVDLWQKQIVHSMLEKAKAQMEIHPGSMTNILPNTCLLQFVQILAFVGVALFKLSLDNFYKLRGLHSKPWEQPTETETSRHSSPQTSDTNFSEQTAERIRITAA